MSEIEDLLREQPGAQFRGLLAPGTAADPGATAPDTGQTLTVAPAPEQTFRVGPVEEPPDLAIPLLEAQGTNSDQYAKALEVSKRTGWPVEAVEADPSIAEEAERGSIEELLRARPTIQRFMTDPVNAKLAYGDTEKLAAIEDAFTSEREFSPLDRMSSAIDQIQMGPWAAAELLGEMLGNEDLKNWGKAGREFNEKQIAARGPAQSISGADSVGEALVGVGDLVASQIPIQASIFGSAGAGAAVGAGLGTLGGPLAPLTVPGGAAIGALVGSLGASISLMLGQAQSALKKRDPDLEAPYAVLGLGVAGGLLERLTFGAVSGKVLKAAGFNPADALAKNLVGKGAGYVAKRTGVETAKGMIREGSTESAQDTLIEYGTAYLADQDVNWEEFGPQLLESFVGGLIMGGGISGATTPFIEAAQIRKANAYRDRVVDVIDKARDSALRERSPEVFQEYMQALAADAGRETLAINAQPVIEYLNEQGVDPVEVFAELGVSRETLNQAYVTGGDVNVDMPAFLTKMPDSEHLDTMIINMRENPKGATLAEAEVLKETVSGAIDKAIDEARELLAGDAAATREDTVARFEQSIAKQMRAAKIPGMSAQGARESAAIWGALANQVAAAYEAEGKTFDAEKFFGNMGLRVERGTFDPERVAAEEITTEQIDPLEQDGSWMNIKVPVATREDGTITRIPAGVARDALRRRQEAAQALLECVSAAST